MQQTKDFMVALQGMLNGQEWERRWDNRLDERGIKYRIVTTDCSYPRCYMEHMTPKGRTWQMNKNMSMDMFLPVAGCTWVLLEESDKMPVNSLSRLDYIENHMFKMQAQVAELSILLREVAEKVAGKVET